MLRLKRINELPQEEDGFRILIDEFWPEGLSQEETKVDLWIKEIRPPTELDEWLEEDSMYLGKSREKAEPNFRGKKL